MVAFNAHAAEGGDPLSAYDYHLPNELVAQEPAARRVRARLLVMPRAGGDLVHQRVADLTRWLRPGDLLVLNDTKVVPARLWARKPSGGRVELMLLSPAHPLRTGQDGEGGRGEVHEALLRSHRPLAEGQELVLEGEPPATARLLERGARGRAKVWLSVPALELAQERGQLPLPPYIKRPQGPTARDARRYQTVYAARPGAVAAPTAGLHFSPELLAALKRRGVETTRLTLHVGYGTFAEPSAADLMAGRLHAEWVEISDEASRTVAQTKARGGRVVAVGTTSLRALEWRPGPGGVPRPGAGWCELLIAPGFGFQVADALLTNFHLPRTTLLMLVAALGGPKRVLAAYAEAVERGYRFYSFGDAMLLI